MKSIIDFLKNPESGISYKNNIPESINEQIETYIKAKSKEDKKEELLKLFSIFEKHIQDWIIEEYSPMIEEWITEEFAPEVENWSVEELIPSAKDWMAKEFIPKFKYKFIEKLIKYKSEEETFRKFSNC